ncbi:MAG TPA: sugar transferase [Acidobacteriota bacterium]|nr:sugar transferase [Acidobacteriota bacterium]HQM63336.1 sugar transferase [Acidobacteriota bacterium]
MIQKREQFRADVLLVFDVLAVIAALPLGYQLRMSLYSVMDTLLHNVVNPVLESLPYYSWFFVVGIPVIIVFSLSSNRLRPVYKWRNLGRQVLFLLEPVALIAFILGFASFLFKLEVSRTLILSYLFVLYFLMLLARAGFLVFVNLRGNRNGQRHVVVVGNTPRIFEIGKKIEHYAEFGYLIEGYLTELAPPGNPHPVTVLGRPEDFQTVIESQVIDEVVFIGSGNEDLKLFESISMQCEEQGIPTRLPLDFFPHAISQPSLDFIEDQAFLTFSPVPHQIAALVAKRFIDFIGAIVGLIICAPLFLVVPILIKLTSRGPVIYRQIRCGLYGRKFVLYKFRSMIDGAEDVLWEIRHLNEMNGPVFKMRNDPRITPLGRFLRKTSIDEIPQFINVLKGELSLVGPRAPLPDEVREYNRWQRRRLSVKPGLTCLWQISGRNEIDFDEWMKLDLQYIDNWSLWLDLKIILMTFPTVLFCRGAR